MLVCCSNEVKVVKIHLRKIFSGIEEVQFFKNNEELVEPVSGAGNELLKLSRLVNTACNVERFSSFFERIT